MRAIKIGLTGIAVLALTAPTLATVVDFDGENLQQLIDSDGFITSDDKLFDRFDFEQGGSPGVNIAEYIFVNPIVTADGPGLRFTLVDQAQGGGIGDNDSLIFRLAYSVSVTDPNFLINEAHLALTEIGQGVFTASIHEEVRDADDPITILGELDVLISGDADVTEDWEAVVPDDGFRITTDSVELNFIGGAMVGQPDGQGAVTVVEWEQTFGQTVIPTPLAAGMGLGLLTVLGVMRRRRAK